MNEEELDRAFNTWFQSRPKEPSHKRPEIAKDLGMLFVFGILFAVIGFLVGSVFSAGLISNRGMSNAEIMLRLLAPLLMPLSVAVVVFFAGIIMVIMNVKRLVRWGWMQHDIDMDTWKLVGDEDFGSLARSNLWLALKLEAAVGGKYVDDFKSGRTADPHRIHIDDELGELERQLDAATPGQVPDITVMSDGAFERRAKLYSKMKKEDIRAGKRFLLETHFHFKRSVGANSAGWIVPSQLSDDEKKVMQQRLIPIFEAHGLKVLRFEVRGPGLDDSSTKGTYETFTLTVRFA